MTRAQRAQADAEARERLLRAYSRLLAERGYHAVTVADVTTAAKMSKTRVYGLFDDREALLLALYDRLTTMILDAIEASDLAGIEAGQPWQARVAGAVQVYAGFLLGGGALARCMMVDVPAIGERGLRARRNVISRYAELVEGILEREREAGRMRQLPDPAMLLAALGGLNELVLRSLEGDAPELQRELVARTAVTLFCGIIEPHMLPAG